VLRRVGGLVLKAGGEWDDVRIVDGLVAVKFALRHVKFAVAITPLFSRGCAVLRR